MHFSYKKYFTNWFNITYVQNTDPLKTFNKCYSLLLSAPKKFNYICNIHSSPFMKIGLSYMFTLQFCTFQMNSQTQNSVFFLQKMPELLQDIYMTKNFGNQPLLYCKDLCQVFRSGITFVQSVKFMHQYFSFFMISYLRPVSNESPSNSVFFRGIHEFLNPSIFEKLTVFWILSCNFHFSENSVKWQLQLKTVIFFFKNVAITS